MIKWHSKWRGRWWKTWKTSQDPRTLQSGFIQSTDLRTWPSVTSWQFPRRGFSTFSTSMKIFFRRTLLSRLLTKNINALSTWWSPLASSTIWLSVGWPWWRSSMPCSPSQRNKSNSSSKWSRLTAKNTVPRPKQQPWTTEEFFLSLPTVLTLIYWTLFWWIQFLETQIYSASVTLQGEKWKIQENTEH